MWYAVYGFVFGMLIPYMARRFSKFMPATMAYAVYRLVKPNQTVSKQKRAENPRYGKLVRRYLMRSVGWGILAAALSYLALHKFGSQYIGWHLAFIWILLLLTEIDNRMQLLPDILTVPLLLLGFAYAAFTGSWVVPAESAWEPGWGIWCRQRQVCRLSFGGRTLSAAAISSFWQRWGPGWVLSV